MQEFLDSPDNKTLDLKIIPPQYIYLDLDLTFSGENLDTETAIDIIKDFIKSSSFSNVISVSDIIQLLLTSGATYVKQPVLLKATRLLTSGVIESMESYDKIDIEDHELFYPVSDMISINKE